MLDELEINEGEDKEYTEADGDGFRGADLR